MAKRDEEGKKAVSAWLLQVMMRLSVSTAGTFITYIVVTGVSHYVCSHPIYIPEICVYISARYVGWLVAFAAYHGIEISFVQLRKKGNARSTKERVSEVHIKKTK